MNDTKIKLDHLIGQDTLKRQLSFYLSAFQKTQILPHVLILGGKGMGKTEFSVALARNLRHPDLGGRPKPLITINSSTVKNVKQFIEDIMLGYVGDQHMTLFFDEVHMLPDSVQTAFLTILNPNKSNKNFFKYEGSEIEFDFRRVSFVFATTDPQGLIGPFKDRCRVLQMAEYNYSELALMVRDQLEEKGLNVAPDTIEDVASVCRGNARDAIMMSQDNISQYMANEGIKTLCKSHWNELKRVLGIYPLGLKEVEVAILRALKDFPDGCSLTNLAARTNQTKSSLQNEFELYLMRRGLMVVGQGGRRLTTEGFKLLNLIEEKEKVAQAG